MIHSAGPDHIKMDGPPGGVCFVCARVRECVYLCACMHMGSHLSVFSPQQGPVTQLPSLVPSARISNTPGAGRGWWGGWIDSPVSFSSPVFDDL